MWVDFIDGEYDIRLSNGSEREYCEISISVGDSGDKDYLFITHEHYDHYSPEDIEKVVGEKTVLQ